MYMCAREARNSAAKLHKITETTKKKCKKIHFLHFLLLFANKLLKKYRYATYGAQ